MGNFLIRILVGVGIDLFVALAALIYVLASEPLWIKPLQQFSDESLTDRVNLLREHGLTEIDKLQAIMFGACPEPLAGLAELLEPKSGQRSSRIFLWSEDETTAVYYSLSDDTYEVVQSEGLFEREELDELFETYGWEIDGKSDEELNEDWQGLIDYHLEVYEETLANFSQLSARILLMFLDVGYEPDDLKELVSFLEFKSFAELIRVPADMETVPLREAEVLRAALLATLN